MLRSSWRLWLVIGIQLLIVAAVPGKKLLALFSHVEVTLETRPFDPYDVLAGYYVTLGYQVETPRADQVDDGLRVGDEAWLLLAKDTPAWRVVSVTPWLPTPSEGEAVLRATWDGQRARLDDLRKLFIPEASRQELADAMAKSMGHGLVDVRVGTHGEGVLLRLRVGEKTFGATKR